AFYLPTHGFIGLQLQVTTSNTWILLKVHHLHCVLSIYRLPLPTNPPFTVPLLTRIDATGVYIPHKRDHQPKSPTNCRPCNEFYVVVQYLTFKWVNTYILKFKVPHLHPYLLISNNEICWLKALPAMQITEPTDPQVTVQELDLAKQQRNKTLYPEEDESLTFVCKDGGRRRAKLQRLHKKHKRHLFLTKA
ncbi:hypothetical protein M8C21_007375, partial [Ambrosia artemisiifolia]